ncbi:LysR substrate-binding domain-containing protein [Hyphomicrobium sp.]|uniref:LysR substrate-binding domain-containing protein n=1 Tax=Hyphomicrobium sp. TaxID=82 RepID=UPI002E34E9CB|nr:LysR substrate-binding domain-containing protein [Hyphomicrobium sp.]HEX2842832.1 LysR substrate-binding domain-containing protein [Hyphomicrobium sp.]
MALPSLNAIRAFEAAARLLSFKDAAEELRLTPSAVSRHIRSLERALGVDLFERGFRQVQLTEKALPYARRLTDAFNVIASATDEISATGTARRRKQKRVTLSINATFMNLWLADRLPRFRAACPECELEVSIHDDAGKGGNPKADLRILFTADDDDDPSHLPLVSLIILPVCAPGLLKGANALRKPTDLARHRLLHENTTAWWEEWIAGEGVAGVDPKTGAIFHDPSLAIREAVNEGGVALADNIMVEDLLARGLLVTPFPMRRKIPSCYALAVRPGASSLMGVKQFRQWLLSEIARHKRAMQLS